MNLRTLKQQGQAWGLTPAAVVASVNGTEVFAGAVSTINGPLPDRANVSTQNEMFSWTLDPTFTGSQTLTITVEESPIWLADTTSDRAVWGNVLLQQVIPFDQIINGTVVTDCMTNVTIDGQPQTREATPSGQWKWLVQPGQTFQATVNVPDGIPFDLWDPTQSYAANCAVESSNQFALRLEPIGGVVYNNIVYSNGIAVAAPGQVPTEHPEIWFAVPPVEWQINQSYATWTRAVDKTQPGKLIVYMAIQDVPVGVPLSDSNYWQLRVDNEF